MGYSTQKFFPVYLEALGGWLPPPMASQLVDEIESKFQRLPHVFGVQQLNGSSLDAVQSNRKYEIQHGGHQNRKYLDLSLLIR
jgi:hypothetical protein